MRHPSELFLLSLLVDLKSDKEVRRLVAALGLPHLKECDEADAYIADLRAQVMSLRPAGFTGARGEDRVFLRALNVDGIYHPDKTVTQCLQILERPTVRRDVLLGFMGRVDHRDLSMHMARKHDLDVGPQVLRTLRHYYFNVDIVDPGDWGDLLDEEDPNTRHMMACMDGGPITTAYRIGLDRATNVKDAVYEVVAAVNSTIHEIKNWDTTPEKMRMLSDSMSVLAKAHAVINTADQELATIASELKQFKLARSVERPLPLALLSKEMRALPAPAEKEKTRANR